MFFGYFTPFVFNHLLQYFLAIYVFFLLFIKLLKDIKLFVLVQANDRFVVEFIVLLECTADFSGL